MSWHYVFGGSERHRGELLSLAIEEALATLPLDLERAVRDCFGLQTNPLLEDVRPGELSDALRLLAQSKAAELLQHFTA